MQNVAEQGEGGNLWPSQCPGFTPTSTICPVRGQAAGMAGQPCINSFPRNYSREQGWRAQRLTDPEEAVVHKDKDMDKVCFPEQWRASKTLLFH